MGARHQKIQAAVAQAAEMVIQRLEERRMLSVYLEDGIWYVEADDDQNHVITIELSPSNPKKIRAVIDGEVAGTIAISQIDWVEVYGGAGNDKITNLASSNVSLFAYGDAGNDTLIGGSGSDNLSGEDGNDSVVGGGGDDYLWGDDGKDTIDGGKGDDEIYGDQGNDQIDGGGGDDTIYAGEGDDDISGDAGNDDIWGGWGDDDIAGDGGQDDIYGGKGDDNLDGGDGGDDLSGGSGNDELIGAAGNDEMDGRDGRDTLAGGLGEDSLNGGRGADQEHGGFDDDVIYGQLGRDTIWGGDGTDTLVGGGNRDVVYSESGDKVRWGRWDLSRNDQLVNPLHKVEDEKGLKNWLIDEAVKRYQLQLGWSSSSSWYDGQEPIFRAYPWWGGWIDGGPWCCFRQLTVNNFGIGSFTEAAYSSDAQISTPDHSDTNTQEQGVDEADLVETDGQYLYSIIGGKLVIISALPAEATQVVSTTAIDGSVSGIYLDGDRLVVLSQVDKIRSSDDAANWHWTYRWYQQQTKVTVFDVSDRQNPTVVEESLLDGWSSSSRLIGGRLYVIMNNQIELPVPQWMKVGDPEEAQQLSAVNDDGTTQEPQVTLWHQEYRYENEQEYRARLAGMSLEELLPKYSARVRGADGQMLESSGGLAGQIFVPDDENHYSWNMSSVVLINLDDAQAGPTAVTNIIGMDGQVYASAENLYVTTQVWERPMGEWHGETRTDIYKFGLGESSVDLEATGEVPGWVLNSFSMDEEGDQFRIATSNSEAGASNNVFVMSEHGEKLEIVGGVTGLALGERIYAARFMGDKAYLVTFPVAMRGWDPLFTVDLSDPTQPSVMGSW